MGREPIGLYLFRYVIGVAAIVLLGMMYWSNLIMEENLLEVQRSLKSIDHQLEQAQLANQQTREKVLESLLYEQANNQKIWQGVWQNKEQLQQLAKGEGVSILPTSTAKPSFAASTSTERPHIDPNSPNLLTPDPYYESVLPTILPKGFKPHGEVRIAALGRPQDLHPFSNWAQVSSYYGMCVPSLSTDHVGRYGVMGPQLAEKIEERTNEEGNPEFWIHLREGVYWEPLSPAQFPASVKLAPMFQERHPVTAWDFKFYLDVLFNPYNQESKAASLRTYYNDLESVEVIDDLTFVVRWKAKPIAFEEGQEPQLRVKFEAKELTCSLKPLPRFVYQYFADGSKIVADDSDPETYRKHSVWAQNFAEHWAKNVVVSCGPWIFEKMSDEEIRFRRNPNYFNQNEVLKLVYVQKFKDSPEAIWQAFKGGEFDYISLNPSLDPEWEKFRMTTRAKEIEEIEFVSRIYAYIGWNQNRMLFKDQKVRQALTMAIDRSRIIEYNLNGKGIELTGSFFPFSPSYDSSIEPHPFDPRKAKRLLESAGWYDWNGDGILEKKVDGKLVPFRFTLTYPVKNTSAKPIVEYIAKAYKEVGIDCRINGVELADISNAFDEKDFDAIYLGWSLGKPPENPRQLWHSSGAEEKGSSNFISFAHPEADQIIERLEYEYDEEMRTKLYHRFHRILHEEAPYVFLYTPKATLLYRDYVKNVFIPTERKNWIPDANVSEPDMAFTWYSQTEE